MAAAEEAILTLLDQRVPGKTICPSEAARALGGDDGFREHMDEVREAAAFLRARGVIEVTQRGRAVDPETARGPIRLGLRDEA
jgi:hypothetical protein